MSEEDIRAAATMPIQPPENAELAACPFCGGETHVDEHAEHFAVVCSQCQASSAYLDTEAEAITAWNLRSILNSPDEAAGDGWLPIESAPKDGTRILGFWISLNGDHVPDVTRYSEGHWRGAMPEDDEENEFGPPDFWRPLPAPPAALGVAAPDGGRS